jgi:hypothetical protein
MRNLVPGDFGHGERVLLKPAVRQRWKTVDQIRAPASADGQCPAYVVEKL